MQFSCNCVPNTLTLSRKWMLRVDVWLQKNEWNELVGHSWFKWWFIFKKGTITCHKRTEREVCVVTHRWTGIFRWVLPGWLWWGRRLRQKTPHQIPLGRCGEGGGRGGRDLLGRWGLGRDNCRADMMRGDIRNNKWLTEIAKLKCVLRKENQLSKVTFWLFSMVFKVFCSINQYDITGTPKPGWQKATFERSIETK